MPDKPMTPERAIIILNNLNTDGRIEVDRDELRAAVKTAQEALRKQIPDKPINLQGRFYGKHHTGNCPVCAATVNSAYYKCCRKCGQALDWGE